MKMGKKIMALVLASMLAFSLCTINVSAESKVTSALQAKLDAAGDGDCITASLWFTNAPTQSEEAVATVKAAYGKISNEQFNKIAPSIISGETKIESIDDILLPSYNYTKEDAAALMSISRSAVKNLITETNKEALNQIFGENQPEILYLGAYAPNADVKATKAQLLAAVDSKYISSMDYADYSDSGVSPTAITPELTEKLRVSFCQMASVDPDEKAFGQDTTLACQVEIKKISGNFAICYAANANAGITSFYELETQLGDFVEYTSVLFTPFSDCIGIADISNGEYKWYSVEEAYKNNLCSMEEIAKAFPNNVRLKGDVNADASFNLRDVAAAQTEILNKDTSGEPVPRTMNEVAGDVNGDNVLNLKDAAVMQKNIAG